MSVEIEERIQPSAPEAISTFSRFVGDVDRFLADFWGRQPLLSRDADSTAFNDLLSLEDVDYILTSTSLRSPAFRLVKAGHDFNTSSYTRSGAVGPQRVYDLADTGRVYEEFDAGATIVLQGVQRFWLPLTRFCRELELVFTHPAQVNVYITPPGSQGLGIHYDTHDVFVLQVSGRKQWEVYKRLVEFPLQSQTAPRLTREEAGPALITTELQPGECLYIPRGYLHEAYSLDETSAHLTVGILTWTWKDVVEEILKETDEEVEFRAPLPIGFANGSTTFPGEMAERVEMLKQFLGTVDLEKIADRLRYRFWSSRTPVLVGQMSQLAQLDALTDASTVRRRKEAVCRLSIDGEPEQLNVLLGDRELTMPADLEPAMRTILEREFFLVGELAEELDEESRLVLVRRLIREGLLEAISPPQSARNAPGRHIQG